VPVEAIGMGWKETKAIIDLAKNLKKAKKFKGKEDDESYKSAGKIVKTAYSSVAKLFKKDEFVQMCVKEIHKAIDSRSQESHDLWTTNLKAYLMGGRK